MCGIVGVLGATPAAPRLVEALKRLEYRGYDSAGVATLEHGELVRVRAEGKLRNLEAKLNARPLEGTVGIGHTRWATHGQAERDQRPSAPFSERLAVVHNGIIENFRSLARRALTAKGYRLRDGNRFRNRRVAWSTDELNERQDARPLRWSSALEAPARRLCPRLSVQRVKRIC